MATSYVNRKSSPALAGQAVLVTVNSSDAANLYLLREGQLATNTDNNKTGTIESIDVYGTSFKVTPIQPDRTFDGAPSVYGYLGVGATISVAT